MGLSVSAYTLVDALESKDTESYVHLPVYACLAELRVVCIITAQLFVSVERWRSSKDAGRQ